MAITDTQIALLRHAAADPDGGVDIDLPDGEAGTAAVETLRELQAMGYVEPLAPRELAPGGRLRLVITQAGRDALGVGPAEG